MLLVSPSEVPMVPRTSVAERRPMAVGRKRTLISQDAWTAPAVVPVHASLEMTKLSAFGPTILGAVYERPYQVVRVSTCGGPALPTAWSPASIASWLATKLCAVSEKLTRSEG